MAATPCGSGRDGRGIVSEYGWLQGKMRWRSSGSSLPFRDWLAEEVQRLKDEARQRHQERNALPRQQQQQQQQPWQQPWPAIICELVSFAVCPWPRAISLAADR